MKKTNIAALITVIIFLSFTGKGYGQKTAYFRPGQIWPDNNGVHINAHGGGILYYQKKYYWFGEHKVAGEKGNKAYVGVHCYSSGDLYHWKDEGIALKVGSGNSPIAAGAIIERPKVIYNRQSGRFVMWFHLELKDKGYDAALCGVAVSANITGPYSLHHTERPDRGALPANPGAGYQEVDSVLKRDLHIGQMSRDMNLFVDEDNKGYLIYTSEENATVHISRLSGDYLHTTGNYVRVFPGRYMEATAIFKHKGHYYLAASGCTGWAPNAARSAIANSIFGPWKELGNPCRGADSAITFHGQSTFVLPVAGKKDAFIFMADKWNPKNAIDGRYIWLPVQFNGDKFIVKWYDRWRLEVFDRQ